MKIYLKEPGPCTSGYEPVIIFGKLMERKGEKIQAGFDFFWDIQNVSKYIKSAFDKILELSGIRNAWEWEDHKFEEVAKEGYVYFIQNGNSPQIKIGWSLTPADRIRSLQTGNPNRLKLFAVQPASDQGVEHFLHDKFKKYCIDSRGEWYYFTEELRDYVENGKNVLLLEGQYDI